jgi:hypothetical protein
MAQCSVCGAETPLYLSSVPLCDPCDDKWMQQVRDDGQPEGRAMTPSLQSSIDGRISITSNNDQQSIGIVECLTDIDSAVEILLQVQNERNARLLFIPEVAFLDTDEHSASSSPLTITPSTPR